MSIRNRIIFSAIGFLLIASLMVSKLADAGNAGAFIGGAVAGQVVGQTRRNKKAIEKQQTYDRAQAAQPVQQAAPAPATQSTQQKLEELDKLAAGGYITPDEYKAKKQAILDSM
jgi:hypothetical protein